MGAPQTLQSWLCITIPSSFLPPSDKEQGSGETDHDQNDSTYDDSDCDSCCRYRLTTRTACTRQVYKVIWRRDASPTHTHLGNCVHLCTHSDLIRRETPIKLFFSLEDLDRRLIQCSLGA